MPTLIPYSNAWGSCLHMSLSHSRAWLVISYPYQTQSHLIVTRYLNNTNGFFVNPNPGNHNMNPVGVAFYPG